MRVSVELEFRVNQGFESRNLRAGRSSRVRELLYISTRRENRVKNHEITVSVIVPRFSLCIIHQFVFARPSSLSSVDVTEFEP